MRLSSSSLYISVSHTSLFLLFNSRCVLIVSFCSLKDLITKNRQRGREEQKGKRREKRSEVLKQGARVRDRETIEKKRMRVGGEKKKKKRKSVPPKAETWNQKLGEGRNERLHPSNLSQIMAFIFLSLPPNSFSPFLHIKGEKKTLHCPNSTLLLPSSKGLSLYNSSFVSLYVLLYLHLMTAASWPLILTF